MLFSCLLTVYSWQKDALQNEEVQTKYFRKIDKVSRLFGSSLFKVQYFMQKAQPLGLAATYSTTYTSFRCSEPRVVNMFRVKPLSTSPYNPSSYNSRLLNYNLSLTH